MRYGLIFLFFSLGLGVNAQTRKIDSLRIRVYHSSAGDEKLKAYLDLFEEYHSLNRDSMDLHAPEMYALAQKTGNKRYRLLADLAYANWYYRWGWSDSSIYFVEQGWKEMDPDIPEERDIYFKTGRSLALYKGSKSRYLEALEVLYKVLPDAERLKDTLAEGLVCNTIGSLSHFRGQHLEALKWVRRAIALALARRIIPEVLAPAYINAANAFVALQKTDSAHYYIQKALPLCRALENLNYLATALRVQADLFTRQGRFPEAEKAMLEMLEVRKKTSPAVMLVEENMILAEFYAESGQLQKAIDVCLANLQTGSRTGGTESAVYTNDPKVRTTYLEALARYYKGAGRWEESSRVMEELLAAKDSLYKANAAEAIVDLQTRYEVQKKENIILQQKYDLQRKNFLFLVFLVLSLLLIGAFQYYRFRQRKRLEQLRLEEKIRSEAAIREAEEKERSRIAADLHDNLGAYAASMAANIDQIENRELPNESKTALLALRQNSRAMISQLNDTIWVLKRDELSLTDISDRIKVFISRLQSSYPAISMEVEESIDNDTRMTSAQAFHLYRIIQEALANALKHSGARQIRIRIISTGQWQVQVSDDGRGMGAAGQPGEGGNGLNNIRNRCAQEGWRVEWISSETGTDVQITGNTI